MYMKKDENNESEIKIALSNIPYIYFFYETVGEFEQEYEVKIGLRRASSFKAFASVADGKTDVAVIAKLPDSFDDNKYEKKVIGRDTLKLAVPNSHWLSKKEAISIKEISKTLGHENVKFVLREPDSGTREQTLALFGKDADLVLRETAMTVNSNEEILATISKSDKHPVKLISLVSSVMCEHLQPKFASLIKLKEKSFRDFYAIREKENVKSEIFWGFLNEKLDIKSNLGKILDILENEDIRKILPPEYIYNKKFIANFHLTNDTVCYKISIAFIPAIERVISCPMDELRSFGKLKYPWYNVHLRILNHFTKMRKTKKADFMKVSLVGDEITNEIMDLEKGAKLIDKVLPILFGVIITLFAVLIT